MNFLLGPVVQNSPQAVNIAGRERVGGGEGMPEFIANLGASMPSVMITNVDVESGG